MRDIFDDEIPTQKNDDFSKLFEASIGNVNAKLQVGDKLTSEILTIGRDEVFVSTGTINDGVVLKKDLFNEEGIFPYSVGDRIALFVTHVSDSDIRLSSKPTGKNISDNLEDAFDMMLPVEGRVTEAIAAGFKVSVMGKNAFCPMSQMDIRRIEKPEDYIGKKLEFLITQFENGKNIVLSRKKILLENKAANEGAFLEDKKPGDVISGVVTRLESYGAFVEIMTGLDALVHISEISWTRLQNPGDALQVGQMVQSKILKMEELDGKLKISLSIKQAQSEPWMNLPESIKVGAELKGKITRCMKYGAFVELVPGIEGLLPLSEMKLIKRVNHSNDVFKENDAVTVVIKELNLQDRRMTLMIPDLVQDDSWKEFSPQQTTKKESPFSSNMAAQLQKAFKK